MGQDSARQVSLDLFDAEPGQKGARSVAPDLQVREERVPVLLEDLIEKRLFGTTSIVIFDTPRMIVVGSNRDVYR